MHSIDGIPMEEPSDLLGAVKKAIWMAVHDSGGLIDLFQAEMAARAALYVVENDRKCRTCNDTKEINPADCVIIDCPDCVKSN
jgi:hypothetical protein